MGNTPGVLSNCLTYVVNLNEDGTPILGTMRSQNKNAKLAKGYKCREAILPATQMVAPAGKRQCFFKNHVRYFYKVSKISGDILSNSMFSQIGKPRNMCSGNFTILEYKQWI
jgi:hypothetical protein